MADIKISDLPQASSVSDADIVVINQGNITKTATRSLIRGTQNAGTVTSITAGTGLTGGIITDSGTIAVNYGTTSTTACVGNDTRLSNSRTPTSHASTHATGGADAITSVALTTGTVSTAPSSANDIANKAYADSIGSGINFHDACNYATIAELPAYTYNNGTAGVGASITATSVGPLSIDGTAVAVTTPRQRVLIKDETSTNRPYNGVYTVARAGGVSETFQLVRATDYDTSGSGTNEIQAGDFVLILDGGSLANTAWVQQTKLPITVGTTPLSFTQFAAAAPGVTTFSTGTTGLTVNQATGQVTLSGGQLAIANGGTGQATAQDALNALAGGSATISAYNGNALVSNGSNATFGALNLGGFATVSGQLPVSNGGTGTSSLTGIVKGTGTTAMVAATSGTDYVAGADVSSYRATAVAGSNITPLTATSTQLTFAAGIQPDVDSHPIALNDILLLTNQTDTTQRGPWVVTQVGTASVGMVLTRPNWFSTNTARSGILVSVSNGISDQGNFWVIYSVSPVDTGITLGTTTLGTRRIAGKSTFAVSIGGTGATTFTSGSLLKGNGTSAISAATSGTDYVAGADVSSYRVTAVLDTSLSLTGATVTATKITFASGAQADIDSHVLAAGDIIFLAASTTSPNSSATKGPWVITTAGATGIAAVWDRPVWWTTNTARSGVLFSVNQGSTYQGSVWTIYPTAGSDTLITVGTTGLTTLNLALKGGLPAASITGAVAITNGGTGATNASNAKINLGVQLKESCKYATVAPLPANTATATILTGNTPGALSVDGVAVSASDRILVKDEANPVNNGIYDVTSAGSVSSVFVLTRSTDANQAFEINVDDIVPITLGAQLANTFWLQKSTVVQVGTSPITFVSSTLGGILPITKGGTGATDAAAARANLGITGITPTDVQIFSTTGITLTWTKPANAKSVHVQLFGAGGGGGGGRKDSAASTAKVGGSGGGGGSYLSVTFPEAAFAGTENVNVGAGGTSGAAATSNAVNGGGGGAGGSTSFGVLICPGGTAGNGGTTGSQAAGIGILNANAGGASNSTGAGSGGVPILTNSVFMYGGAGGGGGGGVTSAGLASTGGAGGRASVLGQPGGTLGAAGTAGGNGYPNNAALTGLFAVGSGGGGGGGGLGAVSGGIGGTGGFPAGGGGGGGATETGATSGAGGAGGNGLAIITTYF